MRQSGFSIPAWAVSLALLLAGAGGLRAEPALLTVGQGWAWVREFFPSSGEQDIQRILWTNVPAQVELDTIGVWNVRRAWPIETCTWLEPTPTAGNSDRAGLDWSPREQELPPQHKQIQIELAQPLSHRMGHSLTYRLPGFHWNAFYRFTIRGIGPESVESVQVDVNAVLSIRNETAASFPEARVSWVGVDEAQLSPPKPFGLLDLNPDTALTDLWLSPPAVAEAMPSFYPLQVRAAVPANDQTELQFVQVTRKPAQITHLCDSDEVPAPTPTGGAPLRRILLIPNTPAMGLGFPLPPGQAELYLGAVRGAPAQSGRVLHTPFPGTLRVDMGPIETVRAHRTIGEEITLPDGSRQADFSLTLVNRLTSPVRIQVIEKPTAPVPWNLVRSSSPCTETSRELIYDLTLPAKSEKQITYRLRLLARTQP